MKILKSIDPIKIIVTLVIAIITTLIINGVIINQSHKIDHGIVIDRQYNAPYVIFEKSGNINIPVHYPATFMLTIQSEKNGEVVEYTFAVPESEYVQYKIGDNYPKE